MAGEVGIVRAHERVETRVMAAPFAVAKRLPSMATILGRSTTGQRRNPIFHAAFCPSATASTTLEPIRFPLALP